MSDVTTNSRRLLSTWITGGSAVMTTLAAIALGGPTVEELREEAARSRRGNALSRVVLAAAPGQDAHWSPVWDGPGGAVPDYLADMPDSLRYLTPRDGWAATRTAVPSLTNNNEVERVVAPRAGACDRPGYFPNWDLFEPVGVRQDSSVRRTWFVPAPVIPPPATDYRPLPVAITATIAAE